VTVYVCTIVLEFELMNRFGKKSDNTLMKLFSYVHYLHYFIDFERDQQKKSAFWCTQALWVFLVSSPVVLLNSRCTSDNPMDSRDWIGLAM
jgi:hypothetical protein